jgi:hypothetical protein
LLASLLKESAVLSLLEKSSKRVQLFTYLLEESSVPSLLEESSVPSLLEESSVAYFLA